MQIRRLFRHWYASLRPARRLLSTPALAQIEGEIEAAERSHSGEIRVAVEAALSFSQLWSGLGARARALQIFSALGVWDTAQNNGVLIYVLLADRAIEIIADRGIAERIPAAEWEALCAQVSERFRGGELAAGCCMAVRNVALRMARFFPSTGGNGNELPNQPVLL